MWVNQFENRLREWYRLRSVCRSQQISDCLLAVNDFWMESPWTPYYLHWDDLKNWPNPWDLLADNIYCDLARALGIVYTVLLLSRTDISSMEIVETDLGNLVQIQHGKYILNWRSGTILNNPSTAIKITRRLDSSSLVHLLG